MADTLDFKQDKSLEKVGKVIGYIFSYFIFTTALYLILYFKKISLSYLIVMLITILISITALIVKKLLK